MKILILCNKSPYPAKEGGPIAINMIVEGLIKAGNAVKVLAMNTNKYSVVAGEIPNDYKKRTGIELVYVDLGIRPLQAFFNLFSNRSFHVERFISDDYKIKLKEILLHEQFDIVQFEMIYMSPYLEIVKQYSSAKTILRAHNIEHKIWERIAETTKNPLKRFYLLHLAKRLKNYELAILNKFDGIATISDVDAEFYRQFAVPCHKPEDQNSTFLKPKNIRTGEGNGLLASKTGFHITTIPFGIDLSKYPLKPKLEGLTTLFSIGAMNWIPNAEGIHWFLESVWPHVTKRFPDLQYYIAGREMPEWMIKSSYRNVIIEGEVEDALQFMQDHSLMIVPLFSGSGIRIKIIEGMALGKAIISTSIGAEGIGYQHMKNILIADSPSGFIEMISAFIKNKSLSKDLGKNARHLIETEYNQDTIIQNLLAFYQKIG